MPIPPGFFEVHRVPMEPEEVSRMDTVIREAKEAKAVMLATGNEIGQKYAAIAQNALGGDEECMVQFEDGEAVIYAPQMVSLAS